MNSTKHRLFSSQIIALTCIAVGCFGVWFIGYLWLSQAPGPTTMLISPNQEHVVYLVEQRSLIDRNFEVKLENRRTGSMRVIFTSPDEGRPIGSERFLWSCDSKWILLTGRSFHVHASAELDCGEQLYLLYDLDSDSLWCNARQLDTYEPFTIDTVLGIKFPKLADSNSDRNTGNGQEAPSDR